MIPSWEYTEIWIREVKNFPQQQLVLPENFMVFPDPSLEFLLPENFHSLPKGFDKYYEFLEQGEDKWTALLDNNEEISSISLITVFNHFGIDGWELVMFSKEVYNSDIYHCILKRKVDEDYEDDDEF